MSNLVQLLEPNNKNGVTHRDPVETTDHLAQAIVLEDNFARGEIEDLLTISQEEEAQWEEETSSVNWISVGKPSKGKKKGGANLKKDVEIIATKNKNKKGGILGTSSKLEYKNGILKLTRVEIDVLLLHLLRLSSRMGMLAPPLPQW